MPFDGFGTFIRLRSWIVDATNSVKIRADFHDDEDNNFAAGLSQCITKDGQTIITQNIPLNSRRIISLADPIDPQDAATKDYADTKMPLDGSVPITGDVTVKNDDPSITLDGKDGFKNSIYGDKGSKHRWEIVLGNATAEAGGDVGSDFQLINYHDDGSVFGDVLFGNRSTGLLTVKGNPTAALGIATKQYTDAQDMALQASINTKQPALGFTPVQQGGGAGQYTNKVYIGWSGGGLRAQVDNTDLGLFAFAGSSGVVNAVQLSWAGDTQTGSATENVMYEPFSGTVVTGYTWTRYAGVVLVAYWRHRYLQVKTTSWFTVGYV